MQPNDLTKLSKAWEEVKKEKELAAKKVPEKPTEFFEVSSSVKPHNATSVVQCHGIRFVKETRRVFLKRKEKEAVRYFCIDSKLKATVPERILTANGYGYKSVDSFFKALNFYYDVYRKYPSLDT